MKKTKSGKPRGAEESSNLFVQGKHFNGKGNQKESHRLTLNPYNKFMTRNNSTIKNQHDDSSQIFGISNTSDMKDIINFYRGMECYD